MNITKEFDGKYWNVSVADYGIHFFTKEESEMEELAKLLVERKINIAKDEAIKFIGEDLTKKNWDCYPRYKDNLIQFLGWQDPEIIADAIIEWVAEFSIAGQRNKPTQ